MQNVSAVAKAEEKSGHVGIENNFAMEVHNLESQHKPHVTEATPLLPNKSGGSWWRPYAVIGPITVGLIWVLIGVSVLVWVMDWQHVTALYVITQIVTTIGYGDHVPLTQGGKLFVTFYALVTILLLGALLSEFMSSIVRNNTACIGHVIERISGEHLRQGPTVRERLLAGFLCFATFVALGTVFFGLSEPCSCSYGIDRVEGCERGPSCAETGGTIKTWVDCFYMSVVTLTTLGFGDDVPVSKVGRIFLIPWCIIGTISMANLAATFGEALWDLNKKREGLERITEDAFDKIEKDNPGHLSLQEFRHFALLKLKLVSEEDLHMIDELFSIIDKDNNGVLSYGEIENHFD